MSQERPGTHAKALQVNLEQSHYGTFAEIRAGRSGAANRTRLPHRRNAAGTIAKRPMSAYDMVFSDAIYGQAGMGKKDDAAGGRRNVNQAG